LPSGGDGISLPSGGGGISRPSGGGGISLASGGGGMSLPSGGDGISLPSLPPPSFASWYKKIWSNGLLNIGSPFRLLWVKAIYSLSYNTVKLRAVVKLL